MYEKKKLNRKLTSDYVIEYININYFNFITIKNETVEATKLYYSKLR